MDETPKAVPAVPVQRSPGSTPEQTVLAPDGTAVATDGRGTDIGIAERREKVLTYRKAGASMRAIATKLGVSTVTVFRDLQHALNELNESELNSAKQIRSMEASRIDDMFFSVWPQAKQGVPQAVDLALRLMERRAKLFGLDAAVKVDVMMQEERTALLDLLQKALPEEEFKKVLAVLSVSAS